MKISPWLLTLCVFLFQTLGWGRLFAEAGEEPRQVLDSTWQEYLNRYAGTTPFEAIRRSRAPRYHIEDAHIRSVLKGNTKLETKEEFFWNSQPMKAFELTGFTAALRLEKIDQLDLQVIDPTLSKEQIMGEGSRFRHMREAMQKLVYDREPDELLLLFSGETHALDLFFSSFLMPDKRKKAPFSRLEEEVYYVAYPLTNQTPFFSPDWLQFVRVSQGTQQEELTLKNEDLILYSNPLARLSYYNGLKSGLIKFEDVQSRSLSRLGVLAFMDWHDVRLPQVISELPESSSLKSAGFSRVTLALEGLKSGEFYSLDDLVKIYRTTKESVITSAEEEEYYKKFRRNAYALLEKGFVSRPMVKALSDKLKRIRSQGFEVRLTGLEAFNRLSLTPKVDKPAPSLSDAQDQP